MENTTSLDGVMAVVAIAVFVLGLAMMFTGILTSQKK